MPSTNEELVELAFPEYWDTRYSSEQKGADEIPAFEWFRTYKKLQLFFEQHLPSSAPSECHILHLGCGNSTLTADLHHKGYTYQTSVDFSQVCIEAMRAKYASLNTRWEVMDIRDLDIPDKSVDVAIDKGTLDAFIHGSMWDPPDDVRESVGKYVSEVARVLKPGGTWLYITYRQPHFMKIHLVQGDTWDLTVENIQDPEGAGSFDYFGFIMRKHGAVEEVTGVEEKETNVKDNWISLEKDGRSVDVDRADAGVRV